MGSDSAYGEWFYAPVKKIKEQDMVAMGNMTISELVYLNHKAMKAQGFHDSENNIGEALMLVVSELGEALEAHRKDRFFDYDGFSEELEAYADGDDIDDDFFAEVVKDTFEDEIADAVLRIADLCGMLYIDLETHIRAKMRYNESRPHKHGKLY